MKSPETKGVAMLDTAMIEQLKSAFSKLERPVTLRMSRSGHPDQEQLRSMLNALASASNQIILEESAETSDVPRVEVARGTETAKVIFRGVPGGHEFTSLVLALLHAEGKG